MAEPITLLTRSLAELDGGDTLLQSGFWGAHKAQSGWRPWAFALGDKPDTTILALERRVGGPVSLLYVPHGPLVPVDTDGRALAQALAEAVTPRPAFVRFDPLVEREAVGHGRDTVPLLSGLRKAPVDIQPPDTVILDLSDDETMLAAMKSKTRYNVRLAERKGVRVHAASRTELPAWYELYRETALRDRIGIHPYRYYEALFTLAETFEGVRPDMRLYLAEHDGELLAGIIVSHFGDTATYLYGASSNNKRNLMPAYLLQWRAISEARDKGLAKYDLFGIPPEDDPAHAMAGLYRFKTGFGGRIVHRVGAWDFPSRPVLYAAFGVLERARNFYHKRLVKRTRTNRNE